MGAPAADKVCCQVSIEWVRLKNTARQYRYFIFLNSSVRGPFFPSYMPAGWQWTQAYTSRLTSQIKVPPASCHADVPCLLTPGAWGS